jgi:hypothetical protein
MPATTALRPAIHSCPLCEEEAIAERCPHYHYDWEYEEGSLPYPTDEEIYAAVTVNKVYA